LDYLTTRTSLSPIGVGSILAPLCKLQKRVHSTRPLTAASDKVYQLLAHGRWFSPGTPASSTTKTGCHDIAESDAKHQKINQQYLSYIYSGHKFYCWK